jgi:hypothetical protein
MTPKWIDLSARRKSHEDEAAKHGRAYKVKVYGGDDVGLEVSNGNYVATVCTDNPDDDGEVVQPSLMDLSRFRKVLAVHLEHNLEALPIGKATWIKATDHSLIAKYFVSQATPETRAVDFMLREGTLHMHSVSFIGDKPVTPTKQDLQAHPDWAGNKVYKGNPLMIEFSVVGQPANDNCDMIAVGKKFGQQVVDRLIGKVAATQKVTSEVVQSVENTPGLKTELDIRSAIGKRLVSVTANVDYDAIIKSAMLSLGKNL